MKYNLINSIKTKPNFCNHTTITEGRSIKERVPSIKTSLADCSRVFLRAERIGLKLG